MSEATQDNTAPVPAPGSVAPGSVAPGSVAPGNAAPGPYRVQLDAYAGPLDLLLYLVKRHEIDLHDIPMAELTEQYLAHLRVIEGLSASGDPSSGVKFDVDRAGEFLVMAATLVEIKSAMLMPRLAAAEGDPDAGDDDPTQQADADPRFELVQQLLAYKRYKDASLALDARRAEWDDRHPASATTAKPDAAADSPEDEAAASAAPVELDLDDVNVLDLAAAFGRLMDSIGFTGDHEVTYDDTPISLHAEDIADRLKRDAPDDGMTLRQLFVGRRSRSEMIGLFLATLELVRQRRVAVAQDPAGGEVRLSLRPPPGPEDDAERPAAPPAADSFDADAYDWPDEATRRRAERRAARRESPEQSPPESADDQGDGPSAPGIGPAPGIGTDPA
ncbi:MAG: segregation/condensation protein A [Planctomycetota bacterium]